MRASDKRFRTLSRVGLFLEVEGRAEALFIKPSNLGDCCMEENSLLFRYPFEEVDPSSISIISSSMTNKDRSEPLFNFGEVAQNGILFSCCSFSILVLFAICVSSTLYSCRIPGVFSVLSYFDG